MYINISLRTSARAWVGHIQHAGKGQQTRRKPLRSRVQWK